MATLTKNVALATEQLAPFEIWEVLYGDRTIKFFKPLVLVPSWMPDDPDEPCENEYLQIIYPELAIDVYGENRDELLDAVHSDIRLNWKHFVQVPDDRLIPATKKIQQNYLAVAEVVDG